MENFKNIIGFEDYQISNSGQIFNKNGKELKPILMKNGYYKINLMKETQMYQLYIHRLIALNFIENTENKPQIDHINRIRTDNRVENIRWATSKENNNNKINNKNNK